MSFIINYTNKQLMIHFSHIVEKVGVEIIADDNSEVDSFSIDNQEFINYYLPLDKGNYQIKIIEGSNEYVKLIIVN